MSLNFGGPRPLDYEYEASGSEVIPDAGRSNAIEVDPTRACWTCQDRVKKCLVELRIYFESVVF